MGIQRNPKEPELVQPTTWSRNSRLALPQAGRLWCGFNHVSGGVKWFSRMRPRAKSPGGLKSQGVPSRAVSLGLRPSQPSPMRRRRSLPRHHPWSRASAGWPASTLAPQTTRPIHFTFCFKATGAIDGNLVTIGTMRVGADCREACAGRGQQVRHGPAQLDDVPLHRRAGLHRELHRPRGPSLQLRHRRSGVPGLCQPARSWATCAARVSRRWRTTRTTGRTTPASATTASSRARPFRPPA